MAGRNPDAMKLTIVGLPVPVRALGAGLNSGLLVIAIPGVGTQEEFVITNIMVFGTQEGRIFLNLRDKSYALTSTPANIGVHWRTFMQGFNPLPIEIVVACGSIIEATIFNDGAAPGNYDASFTGFIQRA